MAPSPHLPLARLHGRRALRERGTRSIVPKAVRGGYCCCVPPLAGCSWASTRSRTVSSSALTPRTRSAIQLRYASTPTQITAYAITRYVDPCTLGLLLAVQRCPRAQPHRLAPQALP